eukprot:406025-Pelagomonas_calceolata.AAC.6
MGDCMLARVLVSKYNTWGRYADRKIGAGMLAWARVCMGKGQQRSAAAQVVMILCGMLACSFYITTLQTSCFHF